MIYLLRHGESTVNIEQRLTCKQFDGDLTAEGRKQARLAGNWLATKHITKIYVSPFHRAMQTAKIIGELVNVEPEARDDLREMDCGELEGHTDAFAWQRWRSTFDQWRRGEWEARFPGGESFREGYTRLARILHEATLTENAVLVSHGGITLSVVPYLCVNAAALQRVNALANTGMIVLEPYDMGRYACMSWDLVEHLQSH
jgi:probable phosphoglycerate mutase